MGSMVRVRRRRRHVEQRAFVQEWADRWAFLVEHLDVGR
jgi:hypothetical protein